MRVRNLFISGAMLAGIYGVIAPGFAYGLGPIGFESSDGYSNGATISKTTNWKGEGGVISNENSAGGEQSLKLNTSGNSQSTVTRTLGTKEWGDESVAFVEFYILPGNGGNAQASAAEVNIDGAKISFQQVSSDKSSVGKVYVTGGDGKPVDSGYQYNVDSQQGASAWQKVDVRMDYKEGVWDLLMEDKPILANIPLPAKGVAKPTALTFSGAGEGGSASYIDNLEVLTDNPVFGDQDRDGMPDAEEIANGMNPHMNDRNAVMGIDGLSNISRMYQSFGAGTYGIKSNGVGNGSGTGSVVFVDNLNGNDGNSGAHSYAGMGTVGPKASLKTAMAVAPSGSTIVVMKGTGFYDEGSRGTAGKPLTIKTVEPVRIK